MLRTEGLVKRYGKRTVANGVSINVKQGEIVGLLGPNGAGKTTSFYMTTGLVVPNEGHVYLGDQEITSYPVYKRARAGIGYLPQEASVFRKMSVEDNIMSVLEMTGKPRDYQKAKLESLIKDFDLQKVRKNLGDQLSGGERRRVEIARCLANDPKFIMLDEPFAGVDPIQVEEIQHIVWKLKYRNIGILITDHNVDETLTITDALCGSVFKVEYTDCGQRRVYLRLYSGTLRLRDTVALAGREKLKITEMRIPSKGEIVRTDTAYQGEIVILPSDSVRLNDVLGDQTRLPRKRWREDPLPMLRTTIAPKTAAQRERLLDALTQLADTDPLLRCEVDSITHEIILSFLGRVQLEVVSALLSEKYKLETVVKEPSVIYMERPLKAASHTIHIEVPPNPFWASIGLSVTPLSLGSGVQYESRVSLGYLNQSFQNAVRDGIRYGLEQGLFGWNVTDCKICFEYGLYYSPVSTPADFRSLAPIVLEQALKESGTQLLEPYLSFILYAPQEYLSRAYHDAPKYCATIETAQVKKDEVVFTGEIPARCIQAYRTDLAFYTNGRSVCLTELKGYQAAVGQPVIQPRRPNSRLDKVRHMFQKVM